MPYSDMVQRLVCGTSSVTTATWTDISLAIPVDVTSGLGILIHGFDIEWSDLTMFAGDNKVFKAILSRDTITAEKFLNDPTVISKIVQHSELVTSGLILYPYIFSAQIPKGCPYFSNTIHIGVYQDSGGTITAYVRMWYSVLQLNQAEMLGLLTNFGVR